jgi:starch synthase
MKAVIVSSEVVPFAKTGGLADVSGALPKALAKAGVSVSIIMPFYRKISAKKFGIKPTKKSVKVMIGNKEVTGEIHTAKLDRKIEVYFIEQPKYFDREELYQTIEGDYPDNAERFAFFSKAALALIENLNLKFDIIHCHDWQSALIPVYLKTLYKNHKLLAPIKSVLTIHNLGYQGLFPHTDMNIVGLGWEYFTFDKLEFYGKVNFLKGGIVYADAITTVSKKYAREILTPEFGCGLEGALMQRQKDLYGLLNGIDYSEWNPATDPLIPQKFSPDDMTGKSACRVALQKHFKLPLRADIPIFGMISRLTIQKGWDLLEGVLPKLMESDVQFVILGTGEAKYHQLLKQLASKFPKGVGLALAFDNNLAHLIEAGSDFFLMPSHYEPCGLNQMISMKYGTIPIVRATGGLDDSVIQFDRKTMAGNGFKFTEYKEEDFLASITNAMEVFSQKKLWKKLVSNAMGEDFSWDKRVYEYIDLYKKLTA